MDTRTPSKIKCLHCPQRFFPNQLPEHISRCVLNKPFKCDLCEQCFPTQSGVNTHKGRFHTAKERQTKYICSYCEHGSNDKTSILKHESMHEEAGGPGFRARSRSRSRAPARSSDAWNNTTGSFPNSSGSTTSKPSSNRRARSCNSTSTNSNRKFASGNRTSKSPTNTRTATPTSNFNWARVQPTSNVIQQMTTGNEVEAQLPIKIDENGLLEIAMLNPEYAERKIEQYKITYSKIINDLRELNCQLRQKCTLIGIALTAEDPIEKKIQAFEAKYGQWPKIDEKIGENI